jgi:hypothetical protein
LSGQPFGDEKQRAVFFAHVIDARQIGGA